MAIPAEKRPGSLYMNKQYFLIKQFNDNYSLIKQLYECPRNIANWASKQEHYMKNSANNKTNLNPALTKLEMTKPSIKSSVSEVAPMKMKPQP